MANTRFQHKRSSVSGVVPTTGDIAPGELGINLADGRLFTSNGTAVLELGSNLTNLSVSSNLTIGASGDLVFTNGAGVFANGGTGSSGQVLTSNGTGVYWSTVAGVNTAAQYSWTNTQTFSANVTVNNATISAGNSTVNSVVNSVGVFAFFHMTPSTINTNYVLPSNFNAISAGPITIANGASVTVSPGSRWAVL